MTQRQRDSIFDHIAMYARAEVDLALAGNDGISCHDNYYKAARKRVEDEWKAVEDLLVVDAWEIK